MTSPSLRAPDRGSNRVRRGSGTFPVDEVLRCRTEGAGELDDGRCGGIVAFPALELPRVPTGETSENVDLLVIQTRQLDQVGQSGGVEGVHDAQVCADVSVYVKQNGARVEKLGETAGMARPRKRTPAGGTLAPSPVATRIRTRLAELGLSESEMSERLGWHRTVLSTTLRRLDEGGGLTTPVLQRLEVALGRPGHWILTGAEPAGVRLADCPGWDEAAKVAAERWGISTEKIALVGQGHLPRAVRYVDASLIRALTDAI